MMTIKKIKETQFSIKDVIALLTIVGILIKGGMMYQKIVTKIYVLSDSVESLENKYNDFRISMDEYIFDKFGEKIPYDKYLQETGKSRRGRNRRSDEIVKLNE